MDRSLQHNTEPEVATVTPDNPQIEQNINNVREILITESVPLPPPQVDCTATSLPDTTAAVLNETSTEGGTVISPQITQQIPPISSQPVCQPKKPLSILSLAQLKSDELGDCFVQLVSREKRTTKTGKPFFKVHFRDSQTTLVSTIWSDSFLFYDCENKWQDGSFYKIRARVATTKYGPNLVIEQIRIVTPADKEDGFARNKCMPSSDNSPEAIMGELLAITCEHLANTPFLPMIQKIFKDNRVTLCQAAASRNHHRNYVGGLLEHTLSVTKIAIFLCEHFTSCNPFIAKVLNRPLVIAGALLHDIGKLSDSIMLASGPQHTLAGDLIGHEILGSQIIEVYARDCKLDINLKTLLQHLILTHSRFPDWDSPRQPMTLEAFILHYADYADSTFISSCSILAGESGNGGLTQRKGPFGFPLLKPFFPVQASPQPPRR